MGVHQKIDRLAHRNIVKKLGPKHPFPLARQILHFEGLDGPDGIKRKSPAKDEPWHYLDPNLDGHQPLLTIISDHIHNMTQALRAEDNQRVAFEAAWLAHAIVDGLTPAHHYPLEAKLEELRDGEGIETRTSAKQKIVLPGKNLRHQIKNNWEYWGAKGVMTTHVAFELGVATSIASLRFDEAVPTAADFAKVESEGFDVIFQDALQSITTMDMYQEFSRTGWTRKLARETHKTLIPQIVNAVTLAWFHAAVMAEKP